MRVLPFRSDFNIPLHWLWFGLILLASTGVKLIGIAEVTLWIDEAYSFLVANGHPYPKHLHRFAQSVAHMYDAYLAWQPLSWKQLISSLKQNVHMPQYYLLLNPWLGWVGNNAFGLRTFSTLFSALTLLPFYHLARSIAKALYKNSAICEQNTRRMALWGTFLMAFAPMQLYYAQEGRMYALSMFWAVTSAWALWHLLECLNNENDRHAKRALLCVAYTLSLLGGLTSHYMFVFYLSFHAAYVLLQFFKNCVRPPKNQARQNARFYPAVNYLYLLIPAFACLGLAWVWFPIYKIQQAGVWDNYHFAKKLMKPMRYICKFPLMPMESYANNNLIARLFYFPFGSLTLWGYLLYRFGYRKSDTQEGAQAQCKRRWWMPRFSGEGALRLNAEGFLLLWLFVPIFSQCGYDLLKETHTTVITRYLLLVTPAVPIWGGLVMQTLYEKAGNLYRKIGYPLLAIVLLYAFASVFKASPAYMHSNKKSFDAAAAYLAKHLKPGDLLFTNGPLGAPNLMVYYLKPTHPALPVLYWVKDYNGKPTPLPYAQELASYRRVWFFNDRSNERRGLDVAREYVRADYPVFHANVDPEGQLDLYTRQ